jgi:hypothetical protein
MKIHELVENDQLINTLGDISDIRSLATSSPAGLATDTLIDVGRLIIQGNPPEFRALQQRAQQVASQQQAPVFFRIDTQAPGVFRLVKRAIGALGGDTRTYFIVQPNGQVRSVGSNETRGLPEVT